MFTSQNFGVGKETSHNVKIYTDGAFYHLSIELLAGGHFPLLVAGDVKTVCVCV